MPPCPAQSWAILDNFRLSDQTVLNRMEKDGRLRLEYITSRQRAAMITLLANPPKDTHVFYDMLTMELVRTHFFVCITHQNIFLVRRHVDHWSIAC